MKHLTFATSLEKAMLSSFPSVLLPFPSVEMDTTCYGSFFLALNTFPAL